MEEVYRNEHLIYSYDAKKDRWEVRQKVEVFDLYILNGPTAKTAKTILEISDQFQGMVDQPQSFSAFYFEHVPTVFSGRPYTESRVVSFKSFYFDIPELKGDFLFLEVWGIREPIIAELKALTRYRKKKISNALKYRKKEYETLKAEFEPKKIKLKDKPLKKIQVKSKAK